MAILPICTWGHPILKTRAQTVSEVTPDIRQLVQNMFDTLQVENGVGLAANQIGVAKRILVISIPSQAGPPLKYSLVNPHLTRLSKAKETLEEGCLSFPGIYGPVERSVEVDIEGWDLNGEKIVLSGSGLLARAFQHESDHLEGMVFIERMNMVHRIMLNSQLRELARQTKIKLTGKKLPSKL